MRTVLAAAFMLATTLGQAEAPSSFTLESLEGVSHTLPEQQEGVGIYLFWASWCPYCQALMPHIQSVLDQYGEQVTVYALNFRDDKDPRQTMSAKGYQFTVFPDADAVAEQWDVHGTPGLFILDEDGEVRFNLYDVAVDNPPGFDELSHTQKAARRAPLWAARMREALQELLDTER